MIAKDGEFCCPFSRFLVAPSDNSSQPASFMKTIRYNFEQNLFISQYFCSSFFAISNHADEDELILPNQ